MFEPTARSVPAQKVHQLVKGTWDPAPAGATEYIGQGQYVKVLGRDPERDYSDVYLREAPVQRRTPVMPHDPSAAMLSAEVLELSNRDSQVVVPHYFEPTWADTMNAIRKIPDEFGQVALVSLNHPE
jgi:hypothetical protein